MAELTGKAEDLTLYQKASLVGRGLRTAVRRAFPGVGETAPEHLARRATHALFGPATHAAKLLKDGDVVAVSGLGTNQVASALYAAIRDRYKAMGHPAGLTLLTVGGVGARGKAPGSVEDLAVEGLVTRLVVGHAETYKNFLKLGAAGKVEIQIMPQGCMCLALDTPEGRITVPPLAAGTMLDPRVGRGSPLTPKGGEQYVSIDDDGNFVWQLPKINVALLSAPACDLKGNIYNKGASAQSELVELTATAKRNGGRVIVQVAQIVPEGYSEPIIYAKDVDCIVVNKYTEQALGGPYLTSPWQFLTLDHDGDEKEANFGLAQLRFMNKLTRAVATRGPADVAVARLASKLVEDQLVDNLRVQIGTGLPEEVASIFYEAKVLRRLDMVVESGVFGGIAAPGAFFGSSIHPREMVSSTEAFRRIYKRLDIIVVGALQVDSQGNVNVSSKSRKVEDHVGPGGFIDLTTSAKCVVFCTSFRSRQAVDITPAGDVKLGKAAAGSRPTFVNEVLEITFNGREALKRGQTVFYICPIGAFKLTPRGLEMVAVMPGIDLPRARAQMEAEIVFPGADESSVPVADKSITTGKGYTLAMSGGSGAGEPHMQSRL